MAGFQFKQFSVRHDRCAMKVGTDSILFGAWANIDQVRSVLDMGCGSGLLAAILARLAAEVVTVERIAPLSEKAEALLGRLGYTNVRFVVGDGTRGFPPSAPYGGIVVTAGSPKIPEPLTGEWR